MVSDYDDAGQVTWAHQAGIDVLRGSGRLAGPHTVAVGDATYTAEHVVIATGADAAIPSVPGLRELPGLWTNREVTALREIPRRLLVPERVRQVAAQHERRKHDVAGRQSTTGGCSRWPSTPNRSRTASASDSTRMLGRPRARRARAAPSSGVECLRIGALHTVGVNVHNARRHMYNRAVRGRSSAAFRVVPGCGSAPLRCYPPTRGGPYPGPRPRGRPRSCVATAATSVVRTAAAICAR
jgi:pyridine nucleotide-disulfide oxidoreductase